MVGPIFDIGGNTKKSSGRGVSSATAVTAQDINKMDNAIHFINGSPEVSLKFEQYEVEDFGDADYQFAACLLHWHVLGLRLLTLPAMLRQESQKHSTH